MREVFKQIHETNYWGNSESKSGAGSSLAETAYIREVLPKMFVNFHVKSVLDIPCGDYYWWNEMSKTSELAFQYTGADIVSEIIEQNEKWYPEVDFIIADATKDWLPRADVIFCRDMLGHLSNKDVKAALKNFRASGAKYLIATTFPGRQTTEDIETGQWRPIDLDYMWGLDTPLAMINEHCLVSGFKDKSLGLWNLQI